MSRRVRWEREGAEVKRGRPLGPTSREGSFSSAARLRMRSCSSKRASAAAEEGEGETEVGLFGSGVKGALEEEE